ncbi:MAG TPA: SIR2 family protein [Rhodocyclaceae bacterium]|nr:SIR2 family protein [Rhodocyclaceae bacterium]
MDASLLQEIVGAIREGSAVPYLGPGALAGVRHTETGAPLPATGDELILALNNGQPMAPRLMYEFPRAAMHVELKRGRAQLTKFLNATYGDGHWTRSAFHDWLRGLAPPYVIDINRDTQLQSLYAATPHTLVVGVARIGGTDFRYKLWRHDGGGYAPATEQDIDPSAPVLFKPHGTPLPQPNYIASDADYVDYITELMGGFAIPGFLKAKRRGMKYVLLGMRLNRDTERMVLSDMIHGCAQPAGWALIREPGDKERRFCRRLGLQVVEASLGELMEPALAAA